MKKYFLSVFLLMSASAQALQIPKAGALDPRMQTATYHPNQVYAIKSSVGRAVLVQLEEDERLTEETGLLGMGDAQAWNLAVKGNNILFKPLVANPDTNLLITTNKRTYAFALSVNTNANQANTYVLRFRYPDTERANYLAKLKAQEQAKRITDTERRAKAVNNQYWGYGDIALKPTAMYDDGRFTYLEFDNQNALPAFYKVNADQSEALVNFHVEGKTVVIHELSEKFILHLGQSVLGIENRGFSQGAFNAQGAHDPQQIRVLKTQ